MSGIDLLPPEWEVPNVFRERLGDHVGRQRMMLADGHLLLVLHEPPSLERDRKGRFFWRHPNGTWHAKGKPDGLVALKRHVAEFSERVTELEEQDQKSETAAAYFQVLSVLSPLRRAARNLHQTLQQAREQCEADRDIINLRDQSYRIERMADLLHSDAQSSLDYRIARQAEEQAKSSYQMATSAHRLNLLAAFFFPLATLSAVFGVNLKHGFEETNSLEDLTSVTGPSIPFVVVLGVGILLGIILRSFVSRDAPE